MPAQKHLIKKYANRKLYDTQTSRYITLDGISELVREGHDIQVVDRETGRDLTPLILSQIVMSEEKRGELNGADRGPDRGQALLDYVRRTLSVPAAIVSGEVEKRRGDVEDLIDVAVEQALQRLSIPSRREIDSLNERLDRLERRLEGLKGGASRPNGRPKAKTTRTPRAAARS